MHEVLPRVESQTVEWIERAARDNPERPFFCYMPLPAPHTPWVPVAPHLGSSAAGWYGDFVHQVDSVIGSVLDALDRTGMASNTLLIVTSDNGSHWLQADEKHFEHLANGDWRGQKADIHEGGHRVPFLVRWPGKAPAGVVRADLVCLTDLFATFAELTEQPIAEGEAEDSMLSVLARPRSRPLRPQRSGSPFWRRCLCRAFRFLETDSWIGLRGFTNPKQVKAIAGGPKGQLYNLELDPSESDNLWSEQPEIVTRLTGKLNAWREAGRTR